MERKAPEQILAMIEQEEKTKNQGALKIFFGYAAGVGKTYAMPILVISARSDDRDKIAALDAGADDYITKPFSVDELLARIRTTLRRLSVLTPQAAESTEFTNGGLHIDYAAHWASVDGQELHLTPLEYKLLCLLARNVGKVLTHQYILREVWGSTLPGDVASLRVFMHQIHKNFNGVEVLKGIDLEVKRGEVLAIIGPSGSGKSTLLRCLNHLESIDRGSIEVAGKSFAGESDLGTVAYETGAQGREILSHMGMADNAAAKKTSYRINASRLLDRLTALRQLGRNAAGGIDRQLGSPADSEARKWLLDCWQKELGLQVECDAIANLWGSLPDQPLQKAIVLGSHHDTVPSGGWLDGALGVLMVKGELLFSRDAVCFYLIDPKTGVVIEKEHCLYGQSITGKILVFPYGKASSVVQADGMYQLQLTGMEPELFAQGKRVLGAMLRFGVTSLEGKSGYGLDRETELRQLRVLRRLGEEGTQTLRTTFLGAHERCAAQGGGDCQRGGHHRGGGCFPHQDPPGSGLGQGEL